jgi:hypothetical protein
MSWCSLSNYNLGFVRFVYRNKQRKVTFKSSEASCLRITAILNGALERCMHRPCLWPGGESAVGSRNEDRLLVLTYSEDPPVTIFISRRLILQYFICSRPFQLQSLSRERCCVTTTRCTSNSCSPTLRYCGIRRFIFRQAFCLLDTSSVPASRIA